MDFRDFTVAEIADGIRSGARSAEAVARSTLARIDAEGGRLNAFVALAPAETVLAEARAVDACVARGEDPGPLAGVPVGVKDIEDVRGLVTSYGSALFTDGPPAQRDSVLVARMRAAGAVVIGKTNTPEFGCKGVTDNPVFGATVSPWAPDRSPGGSSGGAAAALAAGLVPLATGSDGGGSIRIPAANCGHAGFKASQGRVPLADPSAPTTGLLAVRGPMARTVRDTVLVLDAVRGDDPRDVFALPHDDYSWLAAFDERRLPMKAIWAPTLGFAEIDAEVLRVCEAAVGRLAEAGVEIVEREALLAPHPLDAWWTLWTAAMARRLGERIAAADLARIDPPLQEMIEDGARLSAADYARAVDACHACNLQLEAAFEETLFPDAPLVLAPTCAGRVPRLGDTGRLGGRETAAWVEMTCAFNLARNPVATVHAGCDGEGLPVGLQVIGRQRGDVDVLCAAGCFEDVLGGPGRAPF